MAGTEPQDALALPAFDAPVKLLLVVAPYYRDVAGGLVAGARAVADQAGATVDLVEVPGALEIAPAIAIAHRHSNFDGYVALGCIIRGETTHYDTVCEESARGLTLLGLNGACLGNGILTVETRAQALARSDPDGMDKGGGAAAAALHLIALTRRWGRPRGEVGFAPPGSFRIASTPDDQGGRA